MTHDVEFLFDNQLIASVEKLIRSAKSKLLLISPYIDLDNRIKDALKEKIGLHNFELFILFGKNDGNYLKSIKKESLEFFKTFPNVEIRYNDRLHAKYYQNEFEFLMTSLNLYNYSLANNIEVGIKGKYASKGFLTKTIDVPFELLGQGIEKVRQDMLGGDQGIDPVEKFQSIFENSQLLYKTVPQISNKSGIKGLVGAKQLDGYNIVENCFSNNKINVSEASKQEETVYEVTVSTEVKTTVQIKHLSASQLSKLLGTQAKDITNLMQAKGLIQEDNITDIGKSKGLVLKNYMGKDYIAYPDNLDLLNELKKN